MNPRIVVSPYGKGVAIEDLEWFPTPATKIILDHSALGKWLFTPIGEAGLFGPITTVTPTSITIKTFPSNVMRRLSKTRLETLRPLVLGRLVVPTEAVAVREGFYQEPVTGKVYQYRNGGWRTHDGLEPAVLPLIPQLIRRG